MLRELPAVDGALSTTFLSSLRAFISLKNGNPPAGNGGAEGVAEVVDADEDEGATAGGTGGGLGTEGAALDGGFFLEGFEFVGIEGAVVGSGGGPEGNGGGLFVDSIEFIELTELFFT